MGITSLYITELKSLDLISIFGLVLELKMVADLDYPSDRDMLDNIFQILGNIILTTDIYIRAGFRIVTQNITIF